MIGTYLLHYRILKKIGEGGQGEVYQAEDTRLRRIVAIKILPAELVSDEKSRKRFLREAQLASALDHPNICTIYEINEERNLHFIVMQYLEGNRLKQIVRGRPLEVESALSIAIQLADALAAAHERGVIHRDVKATNIIINDRGQAKILDFGLAKATQSNIGDQSVMELTQTGVPFGTAGYMSPEQARGGIIDSRSDIFSLGVVIYEMISGKLPFQGKSSVEVMHSVIHDPIPQLKSISSIFPDKLQEILDKAMAKNPYSRYQKMKDFELDLKQLLRSIQSESGNFPEDPWLTSSIPRNEKAGWLKGTVVGRLINRLRSHTEKTPRSFDRISTPTISTLVEKPLVKHSASSSQKETISFLQNDDLNESGFRDSMQSNFKNEEKRAIAILPFKNLSGDPEADFYSFSLADSLITELATLKSLVVRPSSYIAKYQGQEIDPKQIGEELKVDIALVSTYLKAGTRFRVTPQLIDIKSGEILWSDKIDINSADIITLQDTITQKIVGELRLRISPKEQIRMNKQSTRNVEAYEYYLKGRNHLNRFMQTMIKDDFSIATEMFESALKLDNSFALAYAGIGLSNINYVLKGIGGPPHFKRAEECFYQSMRLDDSLIEPQSSMVYIYLLKGEKAKARAQISRVLSIAPNDAIVHNTAAYLHRWDGLYEQSLREYEICMRLNPTDIVSSLYNRARIMMYQGKYSEALKELESALSYEPDHPFALMVMGQVQYYQGKLEESTSTLKYVLDRTPDLHAFRPIYGICCAAMGYPEKALATVTPAVVEIVNADGDGAYWLASMYAKMHQDKEALSWLRKAIHLGNENYPWFCSNPDWKYLQENSEFLKIVEPLRIQWLELCHQMKSKEEK